MPTETKIQQDDKERKKAPVTHVPQKAIPTIEEYMFISEMADKAAKRRIEIQEKLVALQLEAQIADTDWKLWEDERWQTRIRMNRWNKSPL
jgi:hypothetical protein